MKIAFCVQDNKGINSVLDSRFGRASGFLVYDTDKKESSYVSNQQNLSATQGAGIQSAQNITNQKVDVLISRNCGPKAFRVLSQAGIKIYTSTDALVKDALEKFHNNELKETNSSNVESHW